MDISIEMKRKAIDGNDVIESKKMKTGTTLDPKIMTYISVPSLEIIAIANVATALCKQRDIRDSMRQYSIEFDSDGHSIHDTFHDRSLNRIEKNILNNLSLLPLPDLLKANVSNCIEHVMLQVLEWIHKDRKDLEYIDSILWTNEGTIDKVKTVKQLIDKDTGQHIYGIYKLACINCLEESIPNLWNKLPYEIKEDCLSHNRICKDYNNHLIVYWTLAVNKNLGQFLNKIKLYDENDIYKYYHSLYHNMFKLAILEGNSLAVKYFWNKLSLVEISNNLNQWLNNAVRSRKRSTDILCFLLSKMNDKEMQEEVLQKNSEVILNSLFKDWPWQRYLLPTIHRMWNFLDEKVYVTLLNNITDQIKEGKTTEQLFSSLWCDSPVNFKKCFIQHMLNDSCGTNILCNLLTVKDVVTIKEILGYANAAERKKIIFSLIENWKFSEALYLNMSLFSMVIEVLSKSNINGIKRRITRKHGNKLCCKWISNSKWNMVDSFLNWAFTSQREIDNFIDKTLDKTRITYSLLYHVGNYELVNKFMSFCFDSEEKINDFKVNFARSKPDIVEVGLEDWTLFDEFIDWCFNSEQEINDFKSYFLLSDQLPCIIFDSLSISFNFEFVDNLLSWCFVSSEELKQYKARFVFTREFMTLLRRYVNNYECDDSEWSNWELIKKLLKLFSPLEEEIITKLKYEIETRVNFNYFRKCSVNHRSYCITKKNLFRLIDDDSYVVDNPESGEERYCSDSENEFNAFNNSEGSSSPGLLY